VPTLIAVLLAVRGLSALELDKETTLPERARLSALLALAAALVPASISRISKLGTGAAGLEELCALSLLLLFIAGWG